MRAAGTGPRHHGDGGVATLAAASGSSPVVVTPAGYGDDPGRTATAAIGWSSQGRIVTFWDDVDTSTFPHTTAKFLHSTTSDGQDRNEIDVVDPLACCVLAPDGSIVMSERRDVIQGPRSATGSVAVAYADLGAAPPTPLSAPWSEATPLILRVAEVFVQGFVQVPG